MVCLWLPATSVATHRLFTSLWPELESRRPEMTFLGCGALTALGPLTKREVVSRTTRPSHCHTRCTHVDTEIGRKHGFQKEDSEIGNGLLTVEAPCPSQSPQDHVR